MKYKYDLDDINEKSEGTIFSIQNNETGEITEIDTETYITMIEKGEIRDVRN